MAATLNVSAFGTVPAVVFENDALGTTEVLVCETPELALEKAEEIKLLRHCKVLAVTDATVKWARPSGPVAFNPMLGSRFA